MSQHPLHLVEVGAALDHAPRQAVPQSLGRGRFKPLRQVWQLARSRQIALTLGIAV